MSHVAIGDFYTKGIYVQQDFSKAFDVFKKAEKLCIERKLDPVSALLCNLGICYFNGIGVEQDDSMGVQYFEQSVMAKRYDSSFLIGSNIGFEGIYKTLADCYEEGRGVLQDKAKSLMYLEGYAEFEPSLFFQLGKTYFEGIEVPKNDEYARFIFKKGKNYGDLDCKVALGMCYILRIGVQKGLKRKGIALLQEAIKQNHAIALNNFAWLELNGLYGVEKNPKAAYEKFIKAQAKIAPLQK